jgi:predicted  nucleic acid-binding Zn-ribbon protein
MIKQIIALREHELARQEARIRMEQAKRQIHDARTRISELGQNIQQGAQKIQSKNVEQKRLELDLKGLDQDLKKLEQQKLSAGSQKMLETLMAREDKLRESLGATEDRILEILQSIEELQSHVSEQALELKKQEAVFEQEMPGWNEEYLASQKHLHELIQEDEQVLDGLSQDMIRLHAAAHKVLKRECVIFPVSTECCPNCGIHLAQNSFLAMRYQGQVQHCPSCQGILFYPG